MIATVYKIWRQALFNEDAGDFGRSIEREGSLTRSDFLRVMMTGILSTGLATSSGMAFAASTASVRPVTDLDELYNAWQERLNTADLDGLVDLYVSDVAYINPEGKELFGNSAVREDFKGLLALKPRIDIRDPKHVVYQDIALTTNHWKLTLTNPDGATQELTGGGIEVVRKQADGGWRFIIDDASRAAS